MKTDIWTWLPLIIGATVSEHLFRFAMILFAIATAWQLLNGGVVCK